MSEFEFINKVIELTSEMTTGIESMTTETKAIVFDEYAKEMDQLINDWSKEE